MKIKTLALLTVALLTSVSNTGTARVTLTATLDQHIKNVRERDRILGTLKEFLGTSYQDAVFTYLKGGLSSASVYKFSHDGRSFVIKLLDPKTHDKFYRVKHAFPTAAKLGIAPRVEHISEHYKSVIAEYIPVRTASTEDYEDENKLNRLVQGIKAFHSSNLTLKPVNSFNTRMNYHERKVRRHPHVAMDFGIPADFEKAVQTVNSWQKALSNPKYVKMGPIHRDLDYFNILIDEITGEFTIVDWDNAGTGNIYEDLAGFIVGHFLNSDQVDAVIEEYFGEWAPKYKPLVDVLCQEYYVVLAASALNRAVAMKEHNPHALYLTKEMLEKLAEENEFPSYSEFMEGLIAGSRHLKTPADYQYFAALLLKTFFENTESATFEMEQIYLE